MTLRIAEDASYASINVPESFVKKAIQDNAADILNATIM